MIRQEVLDLLKEKIQLVKQEKEALYLVGPIQLPVNIDDDTHVFQWYCWLKSDVITENYEEILQTLSSSHLADMQQSSVLVYGDFKEHPNALIRMHSICHTGDIFGSQRCDCGYQLKQSMKMMIAHGSGALFYLANHEGRGIGLFSKALTYVLQENGFDTVDANLQLDFQDDSRSYEEAISILKTLRSKPVTLITNNPKKLAALQDAGMNGLERVSLWGDVSSYNEKYLQTKVNRAGHLKEK